MFRLVLRSWGRVDLGQVDLGAEFVVGPSCLGDELTGAELVWCRVNRHPSWRGTTRPVLSSKLQLAWCRLSTNGSMMWSVLVAVCTVSEWFIVLLEVKWGEVVSPLTLHGRFLNIHNYSNGIPADLAIQRILVMVSKNDVYHPSCLLAHRKGKLKHPQSLRQLRGKCMTVTIPHNTACLEKR